jgi:leucyl/phenylalanyl-tRNA--protein transferase
VSEPLQLPVWADGEELPDTADALAKDSVAPGLLCFGGSLSLARLEQAYRHGVFPWFSEGQPVLWWAPDPRMVLPVAEFTLHASLKKTLRRFVRTPGCEVRIDTAFADVLLACAQAPREGQDGTWIVPRMRAAYRRWHLAGAAHSFETWVNGELVGGLYGIGLGGMFFGESMFMRRSDASKIALAALVCFCRSQGISLIDCQQNTRHLASFGAKEIPRLRFEDHVRKAVAEPGPGAWTYDPSMWQALGLDAGPSPL